MATIPAEIATVHEGVRHPLATLRGIIRKYVSIEAALWVGLFLAVWFWVGLAWDYGSFQLLAFDWVQDLPKWFRGGLLSMALAGLSMLVITKLIQRLTVEFHPKALALVLEHRFPQLLGDRLITAVEMADAGRAAEQGYSRPMIDETVREAAARLAAVPVNDVFDWSRLIRLGWWCLGLALLPGVLFAIAYSAVRQTNPLLDFLPRFRETAWTWVRRDLLLQNVVWPRRAYIAVMDFPAGNDMRVGRDAPAPQLRFRAYRWVIADDNAPPDYWRPMLWSELQPVVSTEPPPELPTELLDWGWNPRRSALNQVATLVGMSSPLPIVHGIAAPAPDVPWTVDRVEMALEDAATRTRCEKAAPDAYRAIVAALEALDRKARRTWSRSQIRRLELPEEVELTYWGGQSSNRMNLPRGPGREYRGALSDLRESVEFRARGADYYTAVRSITLVPPPTLQELRRIEYQPAYLHHRPPSDEPASIKGLRQRMSDPISLNGPTSRFSVPQLTRLIIEGTVDKELKSAVVRRRGQGGGEELPLSSGGLAFRHELPVVTTALDLEYVFTDTDEVKSARHVLIDVIRDAPPLVNVAIGFDDNREVIRKVRNSESFMVTPSALIPLRGKVVDEQGGLEVVEYQLTMTRLESATAAANFAERLSGAIAPLIGGPLGAAWAHAFATAETSQQIAAELPAAAPRSYAMQSFVEQRDRGYRDASAAQLRARLEGPVPRPGPMVKHFAVRPALEGLDLRQRLPELKVTGDLDVQPRYLMTLTVAATDNNVETGPGVSTNATPPFHVLIVSELELLVEVGRDEEALHLMTDSVLERLDEVKKKLATVASELVPADAALNTLSQRAQEVLDGTSRARDEAQAVLSRYTDILRELELNRVGNKIILRVKGEIVMPLGTILSDDLKSPSGAEFTRAEQAIEAIRKDLAAGRKPTGESIAQAQNRIDRLIARLNEVKAAMGEVATINKLIASLREIEKGQEQAIGAKLRELQRLQRLKLIEDAKKKGALGD